METKSMLKEEPELGQQFSVDSLYSSYVHFEEYTYQVPKLFLASNESKAYTSPSIAPSICYPSTCLQNYIWSDFIV